MLITSSTAAKYLREYQSGTSGLIQAKKNRFKLDTSLSTSLKKTSAYVSKRKFAEGSKLKSETILANSKQVSTEPALFQIDGSSEKFIEVYPGQAVIVAAGDNTHIYSTNIGDCSLIAMQLEDETGDLYLLAGHLYSGNIGEEINDVLSELQQRNLSPKNIVFSPREDSLTRGNYQTATNLLTSYAETHEVTVNKHVRSTGKSKKESVIQSLVNSEGWVTQAPYDKGEYITNYW